MDYSVQMYHVVVSKAAYVLQVFDLDNNIKWLVADILLGDGVLIHISVVLEGLVHNFIFKILIPVCTGMCFASGFASVQHCIANTHYTSIIY